ncbi:MFS transporter [Pseudomonas fluorescens]|uniref:MFS transporter n=1 Tax=Pseudomonas fluorescens TaxID=294 RepID=A0A423NDV6_PSEFL|nr:MFS transporter [Pseudomonas fluorescens]RON96421.1 MFS transporter [Pseudomonas fluorescens]
MSTFRKYLCLDLLLWIYLGCWNTTLPLIIVQRGSLLELAAYETALALAAIISMLCLAPRVESMRRSTALKVGCFAILMASVLRYFFAANWYSLHALIVIDVIAASAFGMIQPLLGIYPAETVDKHRTDAAFRVRRIVVTVGRIAGPLLAGIVITVYSLEISLLFVSIVGLLIVVLAMALPVSAAPSLQPGKSSADLVNDMLLGLKLKCVLPPEQFLTFSGLLLGLAVTATVPMLVPALIHTHGLAEGSVGLFNAVFAGGAVAGVFFLSPQITKKQNQRNKYVGCWALLTFALCAATQADEIWQLSTCLFFAGAASACITMVGMDKRVMSIPSGVRVRLMASTLVISQLGSSVSFMMTGAIMSRSGATSLMWLYLGVFLVIVIYSMRSKKIWHFLDDDAESELYYAKNHPKLAAIMSP